MLFAVPDPAQCAVTRGLKRERRVVEMDSLSSVTVITFVDAMLTMVRLLVVIAALMVWHIPPTVEVLGPAGLPRSPQGMAQETAQLNTVAMVECHTSAQNTAAIALLMQELTACSNLARRHCPPDSESDVPAAGSAGRVRGRHLRDDPNIAHICETNKQWAKLPAPAKDVVEKMTYAWLMDVFVTHGEVRQERNCQRNSPALDAEK